jgi:PAT family beta-lactamase induction signal transducer AmpG
MLYAMLFLLFYRFPEALLTKMSVTFLMRPHSAGGLGLSPQEFGLASGTVGVIGLTLGGILGGMLAGRDGFKRWLWPMVCAITLPDLVYVYLAYDLPSTFLIVNICVFIEQFGYGFGFTAYMLYLIYYSRGNYKTSHYALCTAFMALSMMIPGLFAGALQEAVGYQSFFLIVIAFCSVTFAVTSLLKIDPAFGKKEKI